jgi:sterol desaturase/sphingolipid hydroxylase (fatty acid hydroxylase superfamily)
VAPSSLLSGHAGPVFVGFTQAFMWFGTVHHLIHHVDLARHPLIRRYSEWHLLHHKFIRCNFGITSPFWDVVFGTYRRQ